MTQDEGKTLVINLTPSPNAEEEKVEHLRNLRREWTLTESDLTRFTELFKELNGHQADRDA